MKETEKLHRSYRVYPSWIDKWSIVAGCTVPISSCYLHAKHDWEPGHHHPHPFRSPSADSSVFLPSKLLIPRNIIHVCLQSQIPCCHHDWGQNLFLQQLCGSAAFPSSSWGWRNFTSWLPCPMTAMWPSANLYITPPSWAVESVYFLSLAPGLQDSWSSFHQ